MTDKYNIVIEVAKTKEQFTIELPQDETILREQLRTIGIDEQTRVSVSYDKNEEETLFESGLWMLADEQFAGVEKLNTVVKMADELKNENVRSYIWENRSYLNSPEDVLNVYLQKDAISYHGYTKDAEAGITDRMYQDEKFARSYLYNNHKEMLQEMNAISCGTGSMVNYIDFASIGRGIAAANKIVIFETGYLESQKIDLKKYSMDEINEHLMNRDAKVEQKRPVPPAQMEKAHRPRKPEHKGPKF